MLPVMRFGLGVLAVICLLLVPSTPRADLVLEASGTGADGIMLSASATFSISGNTLTITLKNEGDGSETDGDKSANTLTGLFFDLPDGITLTPDSATAPKLLQADQCDAAGPTGCDSTNVNVGGEFVYATGSWSGHDGNYGISSSGYIDAEAGGGNFNGDNLDKPDSPDGINFGIVAPTSEGYLFKPSGKNMSQNPLIDGQVVFELTISGGMLDYDDISNVSFQYGTDITEPKLRIPPNVSVPEPSLLLLFGAGATLGVARKRQRSRV